MQTITLEAQLRTPGTKAELKQLRDGGFVPATVYHKGEGTLSIAVKEITLRKLIYTTESHIVNLKFTDGMEKSCIMKDTQFDPVTDKAIHADFQLMRADEAIEIEVPVAFTGNPIGVVHGGLVQAALHKLLVRCLPADMPDHLTLDISSLEIGHTIHVGEISQYMSEKGKFEIIGDEHIPVVSVLSPKVATEAAPAAEATETPATAS
ncbi:MAG: 50S ribosomal protein L25/general stress protein Ctc [Chlorobiales bacterium]|nr:50S ribosomal protein L25/general stress protein Ctc [Chlorobiales bacterium]